MSRSPETPPGFEPYPEMSPFLDRLGPLFLKQQEATPVIGIRILEHHCNNKNSAHGGLFATLADISLGKTASWSQSPPVSLVTTSLTIDYFGAARLGDWIEAAADFNRVGRDIAFANCYITCGDRRLARASGVYKTIDRS